MIRPTLRATILLTALTATEAIAQATPAPNATPSTPAVSLSATYDTASPLANQIAAILAAPAVARDHWGIQVTALDGTPIYSLNEAQLFQPASNAKLFTTAAALALLGPDAVVETDVRGAPNGEGGAILGDLVLEGHGDANLSGRQLPYRSSASPASAGAPQPKADPLRNLAELADQVAATGTKAVTGDVVGDDTAFPWEPYPIGWDIDDMVWGYGAPVSALSVLDNQLRLTVNPNLVPGKFDRNAVATLDQNGVPYYTVDSELALGQPHAPTQVQVDRAPGSRTVRVYGLIADGGSPDGEEIAIADPAEYAAMAFKQLLEQRGITVRGVARAKHQPETSATDFLDIVHGPESCGDVYALHPCMASCYIESLPEPLLATHKSVPLAQDVMLTNKVSENLHAELMLHRLGQIGLCDGSGSTATGARVVSRFLIHAGVDAHDFVFYDGSGLSTHDLVTPRATAKLLSFAAHDPNTAQPQPWFAIWKSSLPIGGEDGTLASRFSRPPLKDHLFAKTGTLGEARALSGYLDAASGRTIIFSIMVGNHPPGTSDDREALDKIVAAIQATQ
jgi:D-alanyl-D-alanine carboxypeptidase/D-alanyl-D-alanine-endopeptidase (penicillin-binding protein 4)